jgi:homocysteine S-methyltransferase
LFLGDGGMETTMIFDEGIELPEFASFLLLESERGREALRSYFRGYIAIARSHGVGFTLDTPTWRANRDWGAKLGYDAGALATVNRDAVKFAEQIRAIEETASTPIAICGTIGPRGDAYHPDQLMSPDQAERYHAEQIATFSTTATDMVSAFTLAYADEATGIVRAAAAAQTPVSISFTVETDGRLPSGQQVPDAIAQIDEATDRQARYFMINCAHPSHFASVVDQGGEWLARLGGIRPNASSKSHAELDQSDALDRGDPDELAASYLRLKPTLPQLRVIGGCCGTNQDHVTRICDAWLTS